MSRTVRLRRWQQRALARLDASESPDFLAVATPGAGKTTFALVALRQRLAQNPSRRIVVVAPTAHLKAQWAMAAAEFDLILEDRWRPGDGPLPGDVHGIVTTYQQVAGASRALASAAGNGLVVLDEIHHAGDERAWGQGIREAFADAHWRLALSGTPFRSDTNAIPFVRYALDEALPDFEYGYGDALGDGGVIRQVEFPSLDGEMEWIAADGSAQLASFGEILSPTLASQRLRTALSIDGEWLPTMIDAAHERLLVNRAEVADAGGLVIATDQDHAHDIASLLRARHRVDAVVATSDDADASKRIARFASSKEPWLVAVRMVSEGVDIPRLSVGVFATTTTTELFFRQAVGRFVRARPNDGNLVASVFLPADRRLRSHADEIARVRRHHLATTSRKRIEEPAALDEGPTEQMSLFAAVSATPVGGVEAVAFSAQSGRAGFIDRTEQTTSDGDGFILELPPLPLGPTHAEASDQSGAVAVLTPIQRRRHLRALNAARADALVHHANMTHAKVNAELNRLAGITRITQATESQLERRLQAAERWLRS